MWQSLVEPFQFAFLRHALIVCTIAGGLCGLLGVYVTLRGMSYIGHGLSHAIFGVSNGDVWIIAGVAAVTTLLVCVFYRPLLFATFDPEVADVFGVNTARMDALLMLLLSFSILSSMKVLGVTLIAAALVIPPVVARMLTNSFTRMLILSTGIGAVAGLTGMYLSYHLDISSGAAIVLVNFAVFVIVYSITGTNGLRRVASLAHDRGRQRDDATLPADATIDAIPTSR